ncbi:MAG TPA: serine/threonine-protein kinase [Polyangiaceae bacterium]
MSSKPRIESSNAGEVKSVTPSHTLRDPPRPTRVGPYRPHALLGSGGMATVYLASGGAQLGSRRCCALKLLHDKLGERDNYLNMFFNEARIASEIGHPHVCSVFDYGSVGSQTYLAMDYVRGKSLAAVSRALAEIADPKRHATRIARVLADACEGLGAIHDHRSSVEGELRVVHRDISPDNLILGFDGFVKVIDFGLAKIIGRGDKTQSGILKGKVSYIAPELLQGAHASAKTDIWALGVVAWELLTGKRLFRKATDAETLRAITEQAVEAPSKVLLGLPSNLDSVVLRALARDPAERYASTAEFGAALWDFLRTRADIVQHRELGAWLSELFPGEEERTRAQLDGLPHAPLSVPPHARRSARLLNHLRARALHVVPRRKQSRWFAALLAAVVCCAWGAFKWSSLHGRHLPGSMHAANAAILPSILSQAELGGPEHAASLAQAKADPSFTVDVERSNGGSEVIVHVRPTQNEEHGVTR